MSEFQKPIDSEENKTPRGAVKFLVESASAIVPTLKNPGRRRGAAEAIRLAKVQVDAELNRLYAIERTARVLVLDCAGEAEALKNLNEALAVQVPQ